MKTKAQKQRAALERREADYLKWQDKARGEESGSARHESYLQKRDRALYDVNRLRLQLGVA